MFNCTFKILMDNKLFVISQKYTQIKNYLFCCSQWHIRTAPTAAQLKLILKHTELFRICVSFNWKKNSSPCVRSQKKMIQQRTRRQISLYYSSLLSCVRKRQAITEVIYRGESFLIRFETRNFLSLIEKSCSLSLSTTNMQTYF